MQTVQEAFKNVDVEDLIDRYLLKHEIMYDYLDDKNVTVKEVEDQYRQELKKIIEEFRKLPASKPKVDKIFYIYRCCDEFMISTETDLVYLDELEKEGNHAQSHEFEIFENDLAEVLDFKIADTRLTKYYLNDILVFIMYELIEAREAGDNIDSPEIEEELQKLHLIDDEQIEKRLGHPIDKLSDKEIKLKENITEAKMAFEEYSRKNELNNVLKSLKN